MAAPPLAAGTLRHRVTLQRRTLGARDGATGEQAEAWSDLATVWASVEPLGGRELYLARQAQSDATHTVRVRYSAATAALGAADRVKYVDPGTGAARTLNVAAVSCPGERRVYLVLDCREGGGANA